MTSTGPVVVATDLTDASRPALIRGRTHADAMDVALLVCHVVPDVFRSHPLQPTPGDNAIVSQSKMIARAAELTTEQVHEVLGKATLDGYRVLVEIGAPEEEIVRIGEASGASLIAVGAKPRAGAQRVLGHVAERVVRYAHTSVLVARPGNSTGKILVATDFSESSLQAVRFAKEISSRTGAQVTLVHVMRPVSSALPSALAPLGDAWIPPSKAAMDQLEELGKRTLESLAKEHGFASFEQLDGDPGDVLVERAETLGAELVVMGSRGRTGLRRLFLGSVAEKVIRQSHCSVLVAREPASA